MEDNFSKEEKIYLYNICDFKFKFITNKIINE